MIPDAEKIVTAYLNGADVEPANARFASRTPANHNAPWGRVTQLDALDVAPPADHLINFLVQVDCYAGKVAADAQTAQAEANLLARSARSVLSSMPDEAHDGAVVTSVRFTSHLRLPDTDFEPARERVVLAATITMHST